MASPCHVALNPELDTLRVEFEQISADVDALVAPLIDDQFTWRPSPHAWSVAECIDHLNATGRAYLSFLDQGLADASRQGFYSDGPFTYAWLGRLLVAITEPPVRLRGKSLPAMLPGEPRRRQDIMAAFHGYQAQYVNALLRANGIDLGRATVQVPVASWLRISLGSGFALMAAHQRRHLWQARRVIATAGFPAGSG